MDERLPEPGWYPDPEGGSALRYWDGQRWASSSGDRRSAETGRDADGDMTQPIATNDSPPAPNQADAWESYAATSTLPRGPFRPLAVVVLLVLVAGAVLAFALGGDGDDDPDGEVPVAGNAGDDPSDDAASDHGQGAGDDGDPAGDDGDPAGDDPGDDGEPAADDPGDDDPGDDGTVVLDDRCEITREELGEAEVSEVNAWEFDACDLAPVDPGDGERVIVITASLDGSTVSEAAARDTAGERELLWSSHYPTLEPGFWVVYLGPFDDEEVAEDAAEEAAGGAYLRRLTAQAS